ncbi:MAG TPA: hypothetical protein VFY71_12010 [Planctomycetota bacterium]|nr:hypothetical protein [Planctomycetota bacterium]
MKRTTDTAALRARLARRVAEPGPARQRGTAMWQLAEEISAVTGEPVRAIFDRAVLDAVAAEMRRAFP